MIGYVDTSAMVPLLLTEPSTPVCRRFWDDCDHVVSCTLLYVEAASALAQAARMGRIREADRRAALALLDGLWGAVDVVEVDETLVHDAAVLAHAHGLRGYDAVHCAAALQMLDDDLVAATGDRQQLTAWAALGLATLDTRQ